jgi:hypothetical protein
VGVVVLDQYHVRAWDSLHRYTSPSVLAAAILTVIAATERRRPGEPELMPLTVNESGGCFATLITAQPPAPPLSAGG